MLGKARNLLVALTGLYIDSGEPVSSAALSKALEKRGQSIPPSTIRLELGRLEKEGYLAKPHPSGGRIPTARAYRVFVDSIDFLSHPAAVLSEKTIEGCRALSGELGRLLEYAGEVLASESGCLGFVTSPSLADSRIARFKLNALEDDLVLLRLELATGRQYYHLARLPVSARSFRLDVLGDLLTERLAGRSLDEVSAFEIEAIIRRATEQGRQYELFVHPLHDLITDARLGESPRTVVRGAAGLLKSSSDDPEALARAVEFLDDRELIERTIGAAAGPEEVKVLIGGDGASAVDPVLNGFALLVASYHLHAQARGSLGILGPMRMPYEHHLRLVRALSDVVSRVLIARELSPGSL